MPLQLPLVIVVTIVKCWLIVTCLYCCCYCCFLANSSAASALVPSPFLLAAWSANATAVKTMTAGQWLLLFLIVCPCYCRTTQLAHHMTWLDTIDDKAVVWMLVANWTAAMVTRITREWAQAVWALGFVLILRDLIRGIKDGQSTLTKTDSSRTSRFCHDITHKYDVTFIQSRLTSSTKSSHIIPQGPHHHQELFESSSRGLQWDFCWNPLRSFQDLGFKNSFEPRLVHL